MSGKRRRLSTVALVALFAFFAAIVFVPKLLYGAIVESGIETRSEQALSQYVERLDRQLEQDPSGELWRRAPGPGVISATRPDDDSLEVSTTVTVEAGGIFFSSGYAVRCYDIVFNGIGTPDRRHELRKVPGCPQEWRGLEQG